MIYELRKILYNGWLCILLVLMIILNAFLFYSHCVDDSAGYTMLQVKERFANADKIADEQIRLEKQMEEWFLGEHDWEIYEDLKGEIEHNKPVLERLAQAENYEAYRKNLVTEAEIKLRLGLFGSPQSFAARSLMRGIKEYEALAGVLPDGIFLGGIELLLSWRLTDYFLLAFSVVASFMLFTYEKAVGLRKLTQPTRCGHWGLFCQKCGASVVLMTSGFLALYGVNGVISGILFGFKGISCAAQSIYGYAGCPARISVEVLLLQIVALKYLWALSILMLTILLCSLTGRAVIAAASMTICAVVSFLMGESRSLWLRIVSLSQLAGIEQLYQGAVYLNLFGYPIPRVPVAVGFLLALGFGCFLTGGVAFCKMEGAKEYKQRSVTLLSWGNHTNLFAHECVKALITWKGALILLLFLIVQFMACQRIPIHYSEQEVYYRNYSQILEGKPSDEKTAFLETEQSRLDDLSHQLVEIGRTYPPDSAQYESATVDIRNQLRAQLAFEMAKLQYEGLQIGQSYLYQTPYTVLFGPDSMREDTVNFGKLFFVIILLLFVLFAEEKETGVRILQVTAGRTRVILCHKTIICAAYAVLATLIAFLPRYIAVFHTYAGLDLAAQASSIMWWAEIPAVFSVGGYIAVILLGRILLTGGAAGIVCCISNMTGNSIMTLIISIVLLMLPIGVLLLC